MGRSGVGCGPVHGGRTERLHLGRAPRVRRPPGDQPEKQRQRSSVRGRDIEPGVLAGGTAPFMPHSSTPPPRRRPCFLKFPQQGSGRVYCPHNPAKSPALRVPNTAAFKGPALKRKPSWCSITASESFAFELRRVVSPLSLPSSKLLRSFFFQPLGSV